MILYHIDHSESLHKGQRLYANWPHPTKPGLLLSRYGSWILSVEDSNSRIFQTDTRSHLYHNYNIEFLAEKVRVKHFPHLPSRLNSLFAVQSIDDSVRWNQRLGFDKPIRICEIEYNDVIFEFDSRLLDGMILNVGRLLTETSVFTQYEIDAEKQLIDYWSGKRTENALNEILVPFPVTISKCYSIT